MKILNSSTLKKKVLVFYGVSFHFSGIRNAFRIEFQTFAKITIFEKGQPFNLKIVMLLKMEPLKASGQYMYIWD